MKKTKKVLNFSLEDSKQVISVVEGLTDIDADIDAESTPSSIQISIYGSESEIKKVTEKVREIIEKSRSS